MFAEALTIMDILCNFVSREGARVSCCCEVSGGVRVVGWVVSWVGAWNWAFWLLRFGGVERVDEVSGSVNVAFFGVLVDDDIWLLRCSCILALL